MAASLSAETQKWFDQNQTNRSTRPISASAAASKRALASLRMICCGSGGFEAGALLSAPGNLAICEGSWASPLAVACFAARCQLLLGAARGAKIENLARRLRARHQIWRVKPASPWPFKISQQRAAGIGAAIAAIASPTGPKPNRWRPSAAAAFPGIKPAL